MQPNHTKKIFHNDKGYPQIEIGVKEFLCCGATKPFDHPHIFLNMGKNETQICPYCATKFIFNDRLKENETIPAGCCSAYATGA